MAHEENLSNLVARDLRHVWHPCTQMQEHEIYPPLPIGRAEGSFLYLDDGRPVIDAISSWWCKSLGHQHPAIAEAVTAQMERFEHVIMAGTVNEALVNLSEKLAALCAPLTRAFYADNGSTGVEVAIKMALQAHQHRGQSHRQALASLRNGYHGALQWPLPGNVAALYAA
jgi:adenosylmethionine-8-amino-7-oxononanoate aminotransferase